MKIESLIEIIFSGKTSKVKLDFLNDLLDNCKGVRFNSPEDLIDETKENIYKTIKEFEYIDLVINSDNIQIISKKVNNVFINLCKNNSEFELLFYFDMKDIYNPLNKNHLVFLNKWANDFCQDFKFENVICKIENGDEQSYYFKNKEFGPSYKKINI